MEVEATTTPTPTPAPAYPLPRDHDDPPFTYGLLFDLAEVLVRHGYPRPAGIDYADLTLAVFRFIYQQKGASS